jgi:signal transduction histidine kinase
MALNYRQPELARPAARPAMKRARIVGNLLSNAAKHSTPGCEIVVRLERRG